MGQKRRRLTQKNKGGDNMTDKEIFDKLTEAYVKTPLHAKKETDYKNGFKDALSLAWLIFEENLLPGKVEEDSINGWDYLVRGFDC